MRSAVDVSCVQKLQAYMWSAVDVSCVQKLQAYMRRLKSSN
jgi:hypothetical protein